ncbi:MAG: choice-of-anchor Q domain-containing protein, partial [Acidiferrobacterales bacterium]
MALLMFLLAPASAWASDGAAIGVMTFTGVDQTTPLGPFASATGPAAGSASIPVTSAAGELVFGVVGVDDGTDYDLIPGAGQTEHWDLSISEGNGGGSTEAGAGPSVVTSWTWPGSDDWAIAGVSIKPSGAIAVDNISTGTTTGASITISHTTSGSDRLMLVGVPVAQAAVEVVTSMTYNGIPLSPVGVQDSAGGDMRVEIWQLTEANGLPTGTHDVVINFGAAAPVCPGGVVTTTVDSATGGSLRACIIWANGNAGADTLTLPAGTYTLTIPGAGEDAAATGDLDITDDLVITGNGAATTIIDGNGIDRVFEILSATATFSDITIQNGSALNGGGMALSGTATVTLTDVAVTNNNSSGNGAGIDVPAGTTLNATGTTISGNTAVGDGGGAAMAGTLTLTNVTVSGNTAARGGGLDCAGPCTLTNVTVTANTGPGDGGGVRQRTGAGSITFLNTIVANNISAGAGDCDGNPGNLFSLGNNLDSDNTCDFTAPGDLPGTIPLLGPLQDNGGPTFTHELLVGSPAIDAGTNVGCPAADQRGFARPVNATCDIGAYEFGAGASPAVTSAVAEISPNDVTTSSTANAFSYDIQATIGGGDTGVDRVAITVPLSFGLPTVTDVQVGGVSVAYTDNTVGRAISVDLTVKVTTSDRITVLFNADAPTSQDLIGQNFLSTVDDSTTGDAPQGTTEGNGDGDAGDNNSWTVTTTDLPLGTCPALDTVSTGLTNTSSVTISHTTSSGLERLMMVGVSINNDGNETVTSVTYGGNPLSLVGTAQENDDARVEIWSLTNPPAGTADVVVTFSADLQRGAVVGVTTFTGVDQTTPLGGFAGNNGTDAGPATINFSSAAGELVFDTVSGETVTSLTAGAGQTELWNLIEPTSPAEYGAGSTKAGAASVTMSWTLGSSDHWAIGAVPIRPGSSCSGPAVTSAVAEISPNNVRVNSVSNVFFYDVLATIGGGNSGVDTVTITVPGTFGPPSVNDVLVGGSSVSYNDNTAGNIISVELATKLTSTDIIQVQFSADAPTSLDPIGVDFTSTVDDSTTGTAAQATTEGDADGDGTDANSWRVTTSSSLIYYVRTDGNDSNPGTTNSPGGAFLTIQKAADTMVAGDKTFVVTGTYNEEVVAVNGGTAANPIIYEALGNVVLDGGGSLCYAFRVENVDYITIDGFEFTNYLDCGGGAANAYFNNSDFCQILNSVFHDTGRDAISFGGTSGNCLAFNNLMYNMDDDGITPDGSGGNHTVRNNTIFNVGILTGAGGWAMESAATAGNVYENNIFWDDIDNTGGAVTYSYNDYINSVLPGIGNISANPLFINTGAGDFHLSQTLSGQGSDSPAVDNGGVTAASLGLDTRTTRTDGGADFGTVDMGYHYPNGTPVYGITGTVFEDINYGGGDGRTFAAADTSAQASGWAAGAVGSGPNVRVELYQEQAGNYIKVADTTTDAAGAYTFGGVFDDTYRVRVVNDTVLSNRGSNGTGNPPLAVQTFRNDPDSGGPMINEVGGASPNSQDAGTQANGADLSTITAQSVTEIVVSGANVTNVSFGFNFDTIVNDNDANQGSLRQFILNSNELRNVDLDQEDNPSGVGAVTKNAGDEHSIFMILVAELQATIDGGGGTVMLIQPGTAYVPISDTNTAVDGSTQTAYTGDTNSAVAETTTGPEVILDFQTTVSGPGLRLNGDSAIVNFVGIFNVAAGGSGNDGAGIHINGANDSIIRNSTIASVNNYGMRSTGGSNNLQVLDNVSRDNALGSPSNDGINLTDATNAIVRGNEFVGNLGFGIDIQNGGSGHLIENNLVKNNGSGGTTQDGGIGTRAPVGGGSGIIIRNNTVTGSTGDGIVVTTLYTGIQISQNSIFGNGGLGIDLTDTANDQGDGVTANDPADADPGGNNLQNYPVLTSAGSTATTTVSGYLNSTPSTTFTIEFFSSTVADPTGFGEGEVYLGFDTVTTNGSGYVSFTTVLPVAVAVGDVVTATARNNATNDTSEFSATANVTVIVGLGGHWPLDETSGITAADVAQGNDGTYQNGVTLNQPGACATTGTAVSFDGVNDFVEIAHTPGYLLDEGTVTLWARANSIAALQGLFSKDSTGFDTGGHLTVRIQPGGAVEVRLQDTTQSYVVTDPGSVTTGVWFHVAFSWGSGGMALYVNGTAPTTDPYTGGLGPTSGGIGNLEPIALGAATTVSGDLVVTPTTNHFNGSMDDVRIYDRALTLPEIQTLANCARTVSGTVYEDVNYGGGVGRDLAAANADAGPFTLERDGVTVELYDAVGNYITSATTAGGGLYSFTGLAGTNHTMRVVNSTVTSTRVGSNGTEVAIQTYRIDGVAEGPGTGANKVGGEQPVDVDAPANSGVQTLATLQAPAGQFTQSIVTFDATAAPVTGVDFGFNFDTIVNTNDANQGSLRQFILNANLLTDNASLTQNGLTANVENSIFMIPGAGDPLGRPVDPNYSAAPLSYTISPLSVLPTVADPVVLDGTTQPDFPGTPIIEIDGTGAGAAANGLVIASPGGGSTIRGLVVQNFVQNGILLQDGNNLIAGNYVGLDADGTTVAANNPAAANQQGGIRVESASNTIGGTTAADRNVISGNGFAGIELFGGGATGNQVYGNSIGVDATGTLDRGNTQEGIDLDLASSNIIGGTVAGARNVISGNNSDGIEIDGGDLNVVQGNYLGTDFTGAVIIPNGRDGIDINDNGADGATGNVIGGTAANAGNLIRGNTLYGVQVRSANSINNSIRGNQIDENGLLGIDLNDDGVTANDNGDGDSGPNNLQNWPALNSASSSGGNTTIVGQLRSTGSTTFTLDFYSSPVADPSGNGEGAVYLGSDTVTTNGGGLVNFTTVLAVSVALGDVVTATATDPSNNTSEFSNAEIVTGALTISGAVFEDINYGGGAGRDYTIANASALASGFSDNPPASGDYVGVPNATVELYNNLNQCIDSTTTDPLGAYSFSLPASGDFTVRVVNDTVESNRPGYIASLMAVQTFRTNGDANFDGIADPDPNRVGGENPAVVDAGAVASCIPPGGTSLPANAQSIAAFTVGASSIIVTDFGFNFDTIVNTNNASQGSLRQFILNSNALGALNLDQDDTLKTLPAGLEHSIFGIPTSDPNYNISGNGEFRISPTAVLETITDPVALDGSIQTANIGDTNVAGPEVELDGSGAGAGASGFTIDAGSSIVRGFVINQFNAHGILLQTAGNNAIEGNYIGTDVLGAAAAANGNDGVHLASGTNNNVIGGTGAGDGNVISGNTNDGILLTDAGTSNNRVESNFIGTNAAGTTALGNGDDGVSIQVDANNNTIGGTAPTARNVISSNGGDGILIQNAAANNLVQGNYIGTDISGTTNLGNGAGSLGSGVRFWNAGTNTVGGVAAGASNIIAFNGRDGVEIQGTSTGITISGNSIFSNAELGVDLNSDEVSSNDTGPPHDIDGGPNNTQNFPITTSAVWDGVNTVVTGTLNSTASSSFDIEVFSSAVCNGDTLGAPQVDPYGEGETYRATDAAIPTNASGDGTFSVTIPVDLTGQFMAATATDTAANDTSEFSACRIVGSLPSISKAFAPATIAVGGTSTLTITIDNTQVGAIALTA